MRFDLREYLADRVTVRYESEGENGTEYVCDCPMCGRSDKLWVNARTGRWICYYCNEGGGLYRLVQELDEVTPAEARRILSAGAGRLLAPMLKELGGEAEPEDEGEVQAPELKPEHRLPTGFIPVYDPDTRRWVIPEYLRKRGIKVRTAATYKLGAVLSGDCEDAECEGKPVCRYVNRLVLPVYRRGELVMFQARAMAADGYPKYLGPPWPKKNVLFGIDEVAGCDSVTLVEGAFDALAVVQVGVPAVGLMGKVLSPGQVGALLRAGVRRVTIMLDGDAVGRAAVKAATQLLEPLMAEVRIAQLPEDTDPASAGRDMIRDTVEAAVPA